MTALQLFEPNPHTIYSIDAAARLANVPRHSILVYYKHGLIEPIVGDEGAYYFDEGALRLLRRVDYLHSECGINFQGVKMVLDLMNEVERLQVENRFLRRWR
jgi:DNA-binding transcriptional MerR regulator